MNGLTGRINVAMLLLAGTTLGSCSPRESAEADLSGLIISSGEAELVGQSREVRRLLAAQQWDSLDQLARELRTTDARFSDGTAKLRIFYHDGAGQVSNEENPVEWPRHMRQLEAWVRERPQSTAAHVALAYGLWGYAYYARGEDFASTVSDSASTLMHERLSEAERVLSVAMTLPEPCPGVYQVAQKIADISGWSRDDYERVFQEGIARYPGYDAFYLYKGMHLLPRWYGRPGEVEAFAAEAADERSGPAGDMLYARLAWYISDNIGAKDFFKDYAFSWPRVRSGYAALVSAYPESVTLQSQAAYLAWVAGDSAEARTRFQQLGHRVDLAVWKSRELFADVRDRFIPHPKAD
jgi:hypothetical protein